MEEVGLIIPCEKQRHVWRRSRTCVLKTGVVSKTFVRNIAYLFKPGVYSGTLVGGKYYGDHSWATQTTVYLGGCPLNGICASIQNVHKSAKVSQAVNTIAGTGKAERGLLVSTLNVATRLRTFSRPRPRRVRFSGSLWVPAPFARWKKLYRTNRSACTTNSRPDKMCWEISVYDVVIHGKMDIPAVLA